ncbi:hypothetical protein LTR56_027773 [Elasticomyces elasticus]|nr:hypothetical protein LTR56_027773 [Elasticomyces elasticus]KAK3614391.1 hypothetical protein LTR22_027800 [Elasticomyces elasticus]KAK4903842.1 hypothetical protein LTR49_026592 [Elasticomyces elasticus]
MALVFFDIVDLPCYLDTVFNSLASSQEVLNTVFALASYPPIWLIERIGRRVLMFCGALGCGACMLIYVVLTTLPASKMTAGPNRAAVVFIILYKVVFGIGWLGTCWIYGPEIAPLKYRHVAGGRGAAGERFSTWVMVFGGGTGINTVGAPIFIWPLLCCFLAAAYVWFCRPETTGKTLEEIDVLFARGAAKERLEAGAIGTNRGGRASLASSQGEKRKHSGVSRHEKIGDEKA